MYDASGSTRDAFAALEYPWLLKVQNLHRKRVNQACSEWRDYQRIGALQAILPKTYGYVATNMEGRSDVWRSSPGDDLAWLLMDRIAFTLEQMLRSVREGPATQGALHMVACAVSRVLVTMVEGGRSGLYLVTYMTLLDGLS